MGEADSPGKSGIGWDTFLPELEEFINEQELDGIKFRNIVSVNNSKHLEFDRTLSFAEKLWLGHRISESFPIFSQLYDTENEFLRKKVLRSIRQLIVRSIRDGITEDFVPITNFTAEFGRQKKEYSTQATLWCALHASNKHRNWVFADRYLIYTPMFLVYLSKYILWLGRKALSRRQITMYKWIMMHMFVRRMDRVGGIMARGLFNYFIFKNCVQESVELRSYCDKRNVEIGRRLHSRYEQLIERSNIRIKIVD